MDTRDTERLSGPDGRGTEHYEDRGLGPWLRRNPSLLLRLFIVMVFSFAASTVASNFSYGLEGAPTVLSVEELNRGELPAGTELGDYVEVRGTADVGDGEAMTGTADSEIAISSRYSTSYFYFGLQETGDNLLIQTTEGLPRGLANPKERVWSGKLETVGTVIFHDTTQEGLKRAGLTTDNSVPVINTGETPQYLRKIFPAYSAIIALWLLSVAWLVWKRNKPFLGL
ncbi:hypothetical protein GBA63_16730 [Rubrobacter tropicus]|uniref:Uncharacterized protein n=1 Tax=Rubrobacter tropicus TaxID=2653851 RepID=A0A6G8QC81_9ACTN|nr:hypothetical protein [Rubrobacter tropicus]QIN84105.1 hypothetical protein GBA63_16730 [Rubrobacter tropicus]